MNTIETIVTLLGSGILLSCFALFYRMGRNQENIDMKFKGVDAEFKEIKKQLERLDTIEKDLQRLDTRVAVVESRLSDISTNVTHLMWQHQALPQKDADEK